MIKSLTELVENGRDKWWSMELLKYRPRSWRLQALHHREQKGQCESFNPFCMCFFTCDFLRKRVSNM